jgi:hypothetical protein
MTIVRILSILGGRRIKTRIVSFYRSGLAVPDMMIVSSPKIKDTEYDAGGRL